VSGHSKWSTIKRKKGVADAKRGQTFTKLGRIITIAAREGGGDPEANFSLRLAMDKARMANMPIDTVERAIKRGTGDADGEAALEKGIYGGYGPGGIAIAVDVLTDSKNRTVSELRKIFEEHGGSLADASSVLWQFHEKGEIVIKCAKVKEAEKFGGESTFVSVDADEVMMNLMDIAGVEDISEDSDHGEGVSSAAKECMVMTAVKDVSSVRDAIEEYGFVVTSVEIVKIAEQTQVIDEETSKKLESLVESLEEHDDVENVWTTEA